MAQMICPRCIVRITYDANCGDFVHDCNSGQPALDQEDVLVIGNYQDYTTNGVVTVPNSDVRNKGAINNLQGTDGNVIDGARDFDRTARGMNKNVYRVRQHQEYISEVKKDLPKSERNEDGGKHY